MRCAVCALPIESAQTGTRQQLEPFPPPRSLRVRYFSINSFTVCRSLPKLSSA